MPGRSSCRCSKITGWRERSPAARSGKMMFCTFRMSTSPGRMYVAHCSHQRPPISRSPEWIMVTMMAAKQTGGKGGRSAVGAVFCRPVGARKALGGEAGLVRDRDGRKGFNPAVVRAVIARGGLVSADIPRMNAHIVKAVNLHFSLDRQMSRTTSTGSTRLQTPRPKGEA